MGDLLGEVDKNASAGFLLVDWMFLVVIVNITWSGGFFLEQDT